MVMQSKRIELPFITPVSAMVRPVNVKTLRASRDSIIRMIKNEKSKRKRGHLRNIAKDLKRLISQYNIITLTKARG
jgi:hypothetical protein